MPQMAPILWLPLFITISLLLHLTKTTIYFIKNSPQVELSPVLSLFSSNWLW